MLINFLIFKIIYNLINVMINYIIFKINFYLIIITLILTSNSLTNTTTFITLENQTLKLKLIFYC